MVDEIKEIIIREALDLIEKRGLSSFPKTTEIQKLPGGYKFLNKIYKYGLSFSQVKEWVNDKFPTPKKKKICRKTEEKIQKIPSIKDVKKEIRIIFGDKSELAMEVYRITKRGSTTIKEVHEQLQLEESYNELDALTIGNIMNKLEDNGLLKYKDGEFTTRG